MKLEFIDLKQQQALIKEQLDANIAKVLSHGQYIMGPEIAQLEQRLANYVEVEHCIGVASGTDALLLALLALDIKAGDEIVTTPFTFISTAEVIALIGAKPVFVDIEPDTYNIDPNSIENAITPKTKAIMPVSLYGQCAEFEAINAIAKKYNLAVIEDAAQSFGATYHGIKSCNLSTIGCTSFFPSKPLGGYGDGGACFTNDSDLAKKMASIRVHGQTKRYYHEFVGVNARLDTLQAAILLAKMDIFPTEVEQRIQVANLYNQCLRTLTGVVTPIIRPYNISVYGQFTISVTHRDKVAENLKAQGIPTAVHYPRSLHLQPALAYLGYQQGAFPIAEQAAEHVLSLPMHPYMEKKDVELVVSALAEALVS